MPNGTIKTHPQYRSAMLLGDDGYWYFLPSGASFEEQTAVTFEKEVKPDAPPGFLFAKDVAAAQKAPPVAAASGPTTSGMSAWGGGGGRSLAQKLAASPDKGPAPKPVAPPSAPRPSTASALPVRQTSARTINDSTAQADFNLIMQYVDRMNWSGTFGPTCRVQTKLKWDNGAARALYLKIKDELHDRPIPGAPRRLYYYVTSMGVSWGKAGFRITGHTKASDKIDNSETHGVLHVDN